MRMDASEPADVEASEEAGETEEPEGELDAQTLDKLARQIYPLLRRQLAIERERAGIRGRWD